MQSRRATIAAAIGAHSELHPPAVVSANRCCSYLPLAPPKLPTRLLSRPDRWFIGVEPPAAPSSLLRRARPPVTSPPQVSTQIEFLQPLDPSPTFSRPSPPPASPESSRPCRPLWPKGHIARSHVIPGPFAQMRSITVSISIFPRVCAQNDSSPFCVLTATCKIHIKS
jgi:hypothetical protein